MAGWILSWHRCHLMSVSVELYCQGGFNGLKQKINETVKSFLLSFYQSVISILNLLLQPCLDFHLHK